MNSLKDIDHILPYVGDYQLPFPHPGSWALNEDSCKFLGTIVRTLKLKHVLEFGSGYSSSIVAFELEQKNNGFIESIDNSKYWSTQAACLASEFLLTHRIRFHVFPLCFRKHKSYASIFYKIDKHFYESKPLYDLVIVDAPHHDLARDGALYEMIDKVNVGALFFVDDSNAGHMQGTIKRWKQSFPRSISIREFNAIGNGITIIKKEQQANDEPVFNTLRCIEIWARAIRNYMRLKKMHVNE